MLLDGNIKVMDKLIPENLKLVISKAFWTATEKVWDRISLTSPRPTVIRTTRYEMQTWRLIQRHDG